MTEQEEGRASWKEQIKVPWPPVTPGLRGDRGLAIASPPMKDEDSLEDYGRLALNISPEATAHRLLSLLSLAYALKDVDERFSSSPEDILQLIQDFPTTVGDYIPPAVSFFAGFWSDRQPEIRKAARTLFRVSTQDDISPGSVFHQSLVVNTPSGILLLALFATIFPRTLRQAPVPSGFLSELKRSVEHPSVGDLVAERLYSQIQEIANPQCTSPSAIAIQESLLFAFGRGFRRLWRHHFTSEMLYVVLSVLSDIANQGSFEHRVSLADAARLCLFQISIADPSRFVSTIYSSPIRSPDRCHTLLAVIGDLIDKSSYEKQQQESKSGNNLSLAPETIYGITGFALISINPSNGKIKEKCQQSALEVLRKLANISQLVDLYSKNGRLALGSDSGTVTLYDTKAGTEWAVLEGHTTPTVLLAFEPREGKFLATYSTTFELRVWDLEPGFFGFFGAANPRCIFHRTIAPPSASLFDRHSASLRWEKPNTVFVYYTQNCDPIPVAVR